MTASLYEKNNRYHMMLSWYQENGDRARKSLTTGIPVQGNNKRKAEAARKEILAEWEKKITDNFMNILFSDYLLQWLEFARRSIAETTYQGASLKEVQDWMGHKSLSTTADTYAHVQAKAKQRLAETMSDLLENG